MVVTKQLTPDIPDIHGIDGIARDFLQVRTTQKIVANHLLPERMRGRILLQYMGDTVLVTWADN